MKRKGNMVGTLIGATLIALSSGLAAAEKADGECAKGTAQCRKAGRDELGADLAPLKKQLFEFAGLPDKQRGPSPSLSRARPAADHPLSAPGRRDWPVLGEGMSFLEYRLSSRLLGLIGWFGGH